MKRKRSGKRKPKMPPVVGAKEGFLNAVCLNTQDDCIPDNYDSDEFDSRMEREVLQNDSNKSRQQAANVSKKARSTRTKSSKGLASSRVQPTTTTTTEMVHGGSTREKDPKLPRQDSPYKEQELKAALAVIRKVMKMDAAEPFNVPVDPVTLGMPDYFDVIDTPMDFGTICNNLENGVKYKNSEDVFRDVQYIWDNCSDYYKKGHYILELMKRVKNNFSKSWTEHGILWEPLKENTGRSHVPPVESTMRCSTNGHSSPMGPMTDHHGHQLQDQMDRSRRQPHNSTQSNRMSYQPHQRPHQCQMSSAQQQPSHPQANRDVGSAGHMHLMEAIVRQSPGGHRFPVPTDADNPTHRWQNQMGPSQPKLNQHEPSLSYSRPCHPWGSCQWQPSSRQPQHSHPQAGTYTTTAGHLSSLAAAESTIRCSKHGPRCSLGPMTDYAIHEQQVQIDTSQMLSQQPSASHGQPNQLEQQTYEVELNSNDPQLFQPQTGLEMESAVHLCSPHPAESMIRCSKRGPPKGPAAPMTGYANHEQVDQIAPSQMLLHHPSASDGQPHQHQRLQPQTGINMRHADSSSNRRRTRGRGPTRCLDLWNMEGKISIATNELGQPIGLEAPKLSNFLGTISRNGHIAPLNYVDWRALPEENKENMWQQVQSKFDINPKSKSWVLKSLGKKWKDWKAELKASRYITHETDEERLADRDERVLPDQWRILISFWNCKEAKVRSMKNKASRSRLKTIHATGRKSFARVREEQRAKRPDGKEPSRADLFILTRTRKDGRPTNEATSAVISQLREQAAQQQDTLPNGTVGDDVFFQVMGQERHGRVRTYGLGPSPSDLGGLEAVKMVSEANAEVTDMKQRMIAMEQTCAQMAAQMTTMMSMMSNMQKSPGEQGSPSEPSISRRVLRRRS